MKKFNEFSISAFVATVPEVKEFENLKGKYVGCHGFFKPDTWEEDGKKRSKIIFAVTAIRAFFFL